jgi:hypothetical protein
LHTISLLCSAGAIAILVSLRAARAGSELDWITLEAGVTVAAMAVVISLGCSPAGMRDPAQIADNRLMAVEAGFNTMLDTLRPLMADLNSGILPSPAPPAPANPSLRSKRFSVRLIASDRNTLRADLHVIFTKRPKLLVSSPLGDFTVYAGCIDSAFPTKISAPLSSLHGRGISSPCTDQACSALALVAGINEGESHHERREDDEFSTSLKSVSTASNRKHRDTNQPSEQSLRLAMGMVANLNASQTTPLETFRPGTSAGVVPPKVAAEEPSILFALAGSHIQTIPGFELDHSGSIVSVQQAPGRKARTEALAKTCGCRRVSSMLYVKTNRTALVDNFGILRDHDDLERLCRPNFQQCISGTPRLAATSLGRNTDNSDSDYFSDEEAKQTPTDGYFQGLKEKRMGNENLQHLAVLFDSIQERDRCLSFFDAADLIPPTPKLESGYGEP